MAADVAVGTKPKWYSPKLHRRRTCGSKEPVGQPVLELLQLACADATVGTMGNMHSHLRVSLAVKSHEKLALGQLRCSKQLMENAFSF